MEEPERISAEEARQRMDSAGALLVCAYEDEEKFKLVRLEGAISMREFRSRLSGLERDREIIFYCA